MTLSPSAVETLHPASPRERGGGQGGAGGRMALACAYTIEGLNSAGVNLLVNGIAFYTTQRFGWSTAQNLLLMMAQGIVYATGALSAGGVARRYSKTRTLVFVNTFLFGLVLVLQMKLPPALLVTLLLLLSLISTLTWPLVESLVTQGCDARRMNRRITVYNMIWSGVGMLVIGVYGTILRFWPDGPMRLSLGCYLVGLMAALILAGKHRSPRAAGEDASAVSSAGHPQANAEVAAARHHRAALWLARISLPASFVAANTLMGLFPKFHASAEMGLRLTTFVASLWMVSRFVTFILLGATSFWHTRPRLLLAGGVLMLAAFLAIVLPAERIGVFAHFQFRSLIALIVAAELLLGVVAGYVFSASLYFGMVLSDGSTEHGGYHEALIGAGMILGPGIAASAQALSTSAGQVPGIAAVSALLLMALALGTVVALRARR